MQKLLYNVFTSDIIIDAASATSVAILQQGSKRRRSLGINLMLLYSATEIKILNFLVLCDKCNDIQICFVDIDIDDAKQKLKEVLTKHQVNLTNAFQYYGHSIANQLLEVGIIAGEVKKSATYDSMIGSFQSGMSFKGTQSDLEDHCMKFLKALSNVGGPVADAAVFIQEKWTLAVEGQLQFDYSGKRTKN